MITDVETTKGVAAITSDQWHVVHSRLVFAGSKRPFLRSIHSEYPDRASCGKAAKVLLQRLTAESAEVPAPERDEVFVRKPNFKSLKLAKTRHDAE
jgi:hypothetical protein